MHTRRANAYAERGQRSGDRAVIKATSQGGCSGMCDVKLTSLPGMQVGNTDGALIITDSL